MHAWLAFTLVLCSLSLLLFFFCFMHRQRLCVTATIILPLLLLVQNKRVTPPNKCIMQLTLQPSLFLRPFCERVKLYCNFIIVLRIHKPSHRHRHTHFPFSREGRQLNYRANMQAFHDFHALVNFCSLRIRNMD